LPFAGATPLKAMYLKKFHQMRLSSFVAAMGVAQVLINAVNSGFALVLLMSSIGRTHVLLLSAIGMIFIGALFFLFFVPSLRLNLFPSLNYLTSIAVEWRELRADSKTIKKLVVLNTLNFCLQSFCIIVAFRAFSLHVSFTTAGLIAALTTISGTINLIPGNLGVSEALILAISGLQDISINVGLHVAVLLRFIGIIWILAFAPFFTRGFHQKYKTKE